MRDAIGLRVIGVPGRSFLVRLTRALALLPWIFASTLAVAEVPDYEFLPVPARPADAAKPVPKYRFMFGTEARWPGALRWRYNHANAPEPFASDPAATIAAVKASLEAWQQSCGITQVYEGETTIAPNTRTYDPRFGEQPDDINVVGWGSLDGPVTGITYAWYGGAGAGARELVDSDIVLSVDRVRNEFEFARTGSHEWGHALGLAHSNIAFALMSGPPDTQYNGLAMPQTDDVRGCRCLYGPAFGQPAGYSCSLPANVELGTVGVGFLSPSQVVKFTNHGNAALTVSRVRPNGVELVPTGSCVGATVLGPGQSCELHIAVRSRVAGTRSLDLEIDTSDGPYRLPVHFSAAMEVAPPPDTGVVELVEYFHAAFGHYFVTHLADEIGALDSGAFPGWARTGRTLGAWSRPGAGTAPVCRFFSAAFAPKSSHFYTSFRTECQTVKASADWTFEGEVAHVGLPDGQGHCAAGTLPVYRLYNGGRSGAPNHRFTTDAGLQQQLIGQGWIAEGAGTGVTMCVPG